MRRCKKVIMCAAIGCCLLLRLSYQCGCLLISVVCCRLFVVVCSRLLFSFLVLLFGVVKLAPGIPCINIYI